MRGIALLLLCCAGVAWADPSPGLRTRRYYLAVAGQDRGHCTRKRPCRTIQRVFVLNEARQARGLSAQYRLVLGPGVSLADHSYAKH